MQVVLKHEVNRVKNGYAARSPLLKVAAHGYSPETAVRNLEHLVLLYLRPFERAGSLQQELEKVGLEVHDSEGDLTVEVC